MFLISFSESFLFSLSSRPGGRVWSKRENQAKQLERREILNTHVCSGCVEACAVRQRRARCQWVCLQFTHKCWIHVFFCDIPKSLHTSIMLKKCRPMSWRIRLWWRALRLQDSDKSITNSCFRIKILHILYSSAFQRWILQCAVTLMQWQGVKGTQYTYHVCE